jgi:type II secretory pathway pseudopilin PulG
MTGSKNNWVRPTTKLLPLLLIITIIGIVGALGHPALAEYGGQQLTTKPVNYTWTLYWNLTDARLTTTTAPQCSACYSNLIDYMVPWYFTAGKSFTIYIANASDVYYWNSTSASWVLGQPITMTATATANSTGGVTWKVSTTLSYGALPNETYANWTVVIVLNNYGGGNWMVFNVTSIFMSLQDLMNNLTKVNASSYIPVSPTIAQDINIAVLGYKGTYTLPNKTSESFYEYPLFRPVYGAETTSSDLYVVLPDLYFFYLFVGASVSPTSITELPSAPQLEASVTLGTGVTVFGPTTPNSTVSGASQDIYGASYTGFGPIYYVTNQFSKLNPADHNYPSIKALPITITVYEKFANGRLIALYNYTTTNANYKTTPESFNVAVAYDFYVGDSIALSAICNATYTDPALLIGVPVIEFYIGSVYDLKANPIIYSPTFIPNPILANKLYVKWLLATTPEATVVSENYLLYYESYPALVPVGEFTGTGPGAPKLSTKSFPTPEVEILYQSVPVFSAEITGVTTSTPPIQTMNDIYVSLMPVFINITQYAPGVKATSQLPLSPDVANKLVIYYWYSTTPTSLITTTPPSGAVQGQLLYAQSIVSAPLPTLVEESLPATFAEFPPFIASIIQGVYVTPEVNWFPAPPLSATYSATSQAFTYTIPSTPQTYYYAFWLTYNGLTVGFGEFELGYENVTSAMVFTNPVDGVSLPYQPGVGAIWPVFDVYNPTGNGTLYQFYDNNTEAAIYQILSTNQGTYNWVLAERAYIAATYTVYNVQYLNLCNETITTGTVSIYEKTPSGATSLVGQVPLSSAANVSKITAPLALTITPSSSGAPVIEMLTPVFNFTLNYYGYVMPSVNYTSRQPLYNIQLTPGVVNVVYFPLIDVNVKVLSTPIGVPAEQYPLWGFAVSVYSVVTGQEMWHAITNSSGMVYVMNVPLNASYIQPAGKAYVMLKVRTISPATDSAYQYSPVSAKYGQTYSAYQSKLGIPTQYQGQTLYAYTLGTRGPFDEDLVVYYGQFSLPMNTVCGQLFNVTVAVENLHIIVTDAKLNVLSSQPVYPCATPSYCPSFYYNVSLVLVDWFSPYYQASQWYQWPNDYLNLTDYEVMGMTWMQPQFIALEKNFEYLMGLSENYYSSTGNLTNYVAWYTGNNSYYQLAALLANYSSASPFAIFTFPSIAPHEGTILVRLFMPGQAFQFKVFYLGQEVFNNIVPVPPLNESVIVTPTGQVKFVTTNVTVYIAGKPVTIPPNGTIIIEASVYPVTFNITSKSGLYPVGNTYLGLTFTDVLYREYVTPGTALGTDTAQQYISNMLYPFNESGILGPIVTPVYVYVNGSHAITETVQGTPVTVSPPIPKPVDNTYSFAGYVLPNLGGFFVNASTPTTGLVPLYMTSISPNTFTGTPGEVYFNLTMGLPMYSLASTLTGAVFGNVTPSDIFNYPLVYTPTMPGIITIPEYWLVIDEWQLWWPPPYMYNTTDTNLYINFTIPQPEGIWSYRLFVGYFNETGVTAVYNVTATVYVQLTNGTWYRVYSVPLTQEFRFGVGRVNPVSIFINYTAISALVPPSKVANLSIVFYLNYTYSNAANITFAYGWWPWLTTGMGGYVTPVSEPLYVNSTGATMYLNYTEVEVDPLWYPYFGSPLTVVVPVNATGEAVFDVPWWAPTTAAYGTRIARFWIMGTTSTPNVGYGSITPVITPSQYVAGTVSPLPEYAISSYVLLNYITPMGNATTVYTGEIPYGIVTYNGTLYITAIGAGTGGTSAPMLMFDTLFPENLWNVTLGAIQAVGGVYNLRTVALESVEVYNNASFPVFVTGFTYSTPSGTSAISVPTTELAPGAIVDIPAQYIYGSSYRFVSKWCDLGNYTPYIPGLSAKVYYVPPSFNFTLVNGTTLQFRVYSNGTVKIMLNNHVVRQFSISQIEAPLVSPSINFTTLYAGSELTKLNTSVAIPQFGESARANVYYESYYNATTSSIVGADSFVHDHMLYPTNGTTHAYWNIAGYAGPLPSASNDTEAKLYFWYPTAALGAVEDWDGRPLPNQMVVEYVSGAPRFCAGVAPIAIDFSNLNGQLMQPLPNATAMGVHANIAVYWYDSCLLYNITRGAYPYIDIYDTAIQYDVQTLGDAFSTAVVETHVVPATIYLKSATGTGIPGALVVVFDQPTMGDEFLGFNVTGTDGSITPVDYRIYPPATSQLPPTNYYLVAYYNATGTPLTWQQIEQAISSGKPLYLVPVFENTFSIQRTVTATEAIESFTLTNILTTANIVVVLSSFGPAPGVNVTYIVYEPECPITVTQVSAPTTVGYVYSVTPLVPSPSVCKLTIAVNRSGTTNAQGQLTTATFVTPVAPFAAQVTITVQSWKGIPLGYTYTYYITSSNATTPLQVSVPAVELTVTPVSASGAPLMSEATVNVTCGGVTVASGVGQQTVVVPIPSSGSITCTITGYSYGKTASTTVTLTSAQAGQTITKTLTIPVSGYYIPGVGFVPTSTLILLAVVIIIIIILIVILLIEYSNWRRRRLAGLLGPPK